MTTWLIPCNVKYYDVIGAFNNLSCLNWKQSSPVEVGDTVFIYVGKPYSAILFKCRVNKVNLSKIEIDDSAFVVKGDVYENYGNHMELELIEKYSPDKFNLDNLKRHGLKGNIQGPRRASTEIIQLLNSQ